MVDHHQQSDRSQYSRRARYLPGLLMVSPIGVVIAAAGWQDARIVTVLAGAAVNAGVPLVLESFVRQAGLQFDVARLKGSSGRWTTTVMLWPEPDASAVAARNAANRRVVERVLGTTLPGATPRDATETAAVTAALDEAVAELRAITRDAEQFPLLASENAEYGMWRNLLGVRRYGLVIAAVAAVAAAVLIASSITGNVTSSTAELVVGLLVIAAIGAFWWAIPDEQRVVQAAQRYALALFDTARMLGHGEPVGRTR